MSCPIKKADRDMHVDLISDLPRNVIDSILKKLPIRDAVRTSILSSKWRYMWLTVPRLKFHDSFFENIRIGGHIQDLEIPSVITEILLLHDGPLEEFSVHIPHDYPTRVRCLSQWILYLSRSGIKEIELDNKQPDSYEIPSHLFSCLHLVLLELTHFALRPPPDFGGFKCLFELHLFDIRIESDMLESLISGCPLLHDLTISHCFGFDCLNISAPNLHVLMIEYNFPLEPICLKKLKNLVDLTIIQQYMEDVEGGRRSNLVDFFSSLPKIEKLRLGNDSLEIRTWKLQPILSCFGESACNGCSFSQLRTVKIMVDITFEPAVDFTKYILANSPVLEILTFNIDQELSDAGKVLGVARDLLQIGRASKKAEVKFLCDGFF